MHVLQFTEASGGGVGRHLHLLVPALVRRGIEVEVWLSPLRADAALRNALRDWRNAGCDITLLALPRRPAPFRDVAAMLRLRRRLRNIAPCILHTHAAKAGVLGRLAALGIDGVRTVHSPHAFFFEAWPPGTRRRRAGAALETWLAARTDALVFVSESERALARQLPGFPWERSRCIPNGLPANWEQSLVPRAEARRGLGLPGTGCVLGFVGRFCAQKAPELLMQAVRLLDSPPGCDCLTCLCGAPEKEQDRLRRLSDRLGLGQRLHWPGFIPEAGRRLRAFDLLILPSRYEALPYVLLEALAAGVPVLASDIPGHRLSPEIDANVDRFPQGDARALAHSIQKALQRPRAQTMARLRRAQQRVRQEFRLEEQAARLAALYHELVSARR